MSASPRARASLRLVRPLTALCLAATFANCTCDDGGGTSQAGGRVTFEREMVEFGDVIVGQQKEVRFLVKNNGRGALNIRAIEKKDPLHFPDTVRYTPPRMLLEPGDELPLTLFFEPDVEGEINATLIFNNDSAEEFVELALHGRGVVTKLTLTPPEVDFGPVIVEEIASRTSTLKNEGEGSVTALIDLGGDGSAFFRLNVPGTDAHAVTLAKGESIDLGLSFVPGTVGASTAQVTIKACSSCEPQLLRLSGRGVAAGLIAEPESLDFGTVIPNTRKVLPLTFRNIGNRKISITNIRTAAGGNEFFAQNSGGWPALEPEQSAVVNVTYAPTTLGGDVSQLIVETDDGRSPRFDVGLKGYGGGPDLSLSPQVLDFGQVAVNYPVTRRLVLGNKGLNDTTSDADDLIVSTIELPGGTDFSYALANGATLPLHIAPGTKQVVDVTYDPSGDGADVSELRLTTNDADLPIAAVALKGEAKTYGACDATITPAAVPGLQFGVVPRGRSARLPFIIRNVGVSDCVIGKIDLAADASPAFTLPDGPVYGKILRAPTPATPADPNSEIVQQLVTEVEFTPPGTTPSGTNFSSLLEVQLSGRDPNRTIQLSGRAAEVCLSITPSSVDFGIVEPLCETSDRTFTIYNACRTTVKIDKVELVQGTTDFRLLTPPGLPRALTAGQELRFNARYHPTSLGQHLGSIEIRTDQTTVTGGLPYVIALTGRGERDASMDEIFHQADKARADILFVVDNSGSMGEEQSTLGEQFDAFMSFARSQQIDYHLAVTTTDACDSSSENGRFVPMSGGVRIITPILPDPSATFIENTDVGTDGCSDETGLEAAYLALSDPNINGPNAGFLRNDAYLSIIIVSDEEDGSSRTLDFYANYFQNLKGARGANLVSVSGIVGLNPLDPTDTSGCDGPGGSADYGSRYIEIARRTNGISESICKSDWSTALEKLGLIAFGYKSRFILSSEPDLDSIHVFIDGVEIPAGPLWTYTPDAHALDFLPIAVPPAGSEIRVSYAVACH